MRHQENEWHTGANVNRPTDGVDNTDGINIIQQGGSERHSLATRYLAEAITSPLILASLLAKDKVNKKTVLHQVN